MNVGGDPPWMVIARGELGVAEIPGPRSNPRILEYLAACSGGAARWAAMDSTPHCAAFVSWCLLGAGMPATRSLAARSWLTYGREVATKDARPGDVLVFWRGRALPASVLEAPGHVAFFDSWNQPGYLNALGGNQRNRVSIAPYPRARLLAVRRPLGA